MLRVFTQPLAAYSKCWLMIARASSSLFQCLTSSARRPDPRLHSAQWLSHTISNPEPPSRPGSPRRITPPSGLHVGHLVMKGWAGFGRARRSDGAGRRKPQEPSSRCRERSGCLLRSTRMAAGPCFVSTRTPASTPPPKINPTIASSAVVMGP